MAGAAGGALIFFMLMIGSVIVGLYAGAYAAHLFLVTIDGTSSGYDEVTWPDEPYFDWVWKLFYLLWLITLWLVPLLFYSRYQLHSQTPPVALTRIVIAFVVTFWLLFPITMLSSMGGPSRWHILYPPALRRVAARPGSMAFFYLVSGPVLAAGGLSAALMFFYGPLLPCVAIGAVGLAVVLLLYARLFGRLALALQAVVIPGEAKPKGRTRYRHSPQVSAAARDPMVQGGRARFVQPEDLPPTDAPDPDARVGYNVRLTDAPEPEERPAEQRRRPVDLDEGQYGLADPLPHGATLPRGPLPAEWSNPRQYEMELAGGGKKPVRAEHPWAGGIFGFPFRPANFRALGWLALLFVMFGILIRLAIQSVPV